MRPSTIKNVALLQWGSPYAKEYSRMLYVLSGEVQLYDCSIMCPGGYAIWTARQGVVRGSLVLVLDRASKRVTWCGLRNGSGERLPAR